MLLSSGEGRGTALTGSNSVSHSMASSSRNKYTHEIGTRFIIISIIKQLDIKIKDIIPSV